MLKGYWEYIKESNYEETVSEFCAYNGINHWTINDKGEVDVDDNVRLSFMRETELPFPFGTINGNFNCNKSMLDEDCYVPLESLENFPHTVNGYVDIMENALTSLEGCTKKIAGNFACNHNKLTSFVGGPDYVGGRYSAQDNDIRSFEGFPINFRDRGSVNLYKSPVNVIYSIFNTQPYPSKSIRYINEWGVIDADDMTISYGALCEVFEDMKMKAWEWEDVDRVVHEHYTLID